MSTGTAETWDSGQAYEPYMGRWSRLVAAEFLRWLPAVPSSAWCDVGCGTGALSDAVLATAEPSRVVGIDPSAAYLAAAAARIADPRYAVRQGNATAIPAGDGEFDRVVSALVLNFVPDQPGAVAEMRRVASAGGLVAAYVWDYSEGPATRRRRHHRPAGPRLGRPRNDPLTPRPGCGGQRWQRL